MTKDGNGFKAALNNTVAAFGPDSRFGVVKDDLIEMPVPPVTIDNRPFVPWQFFQGFLIRAAALDATWDAAAQCCRFIRAQTHASACRSPSRTCRGSRRSS